MKSLLLVAASALALATGGCTAAKPTARAALDCPATEGDLTRTGIAPDRKSCTYRTDDGAEVALQLVSTNGDPWGALKTIETSLVGDAAPANEATAPKSASEAADDPKAAAEDARKAADDAARVAEEAARDAGVEASDGDVNIRVAGKTVVATTTDKDGETARVDLPGVHIIAGENDANVRIGGISINADDEEATIRVTRDVRLKGEALSRQKRGVRATFIYSGKDLSNGYTYVGYEAGGPKAGPLAVATVRFKGTDGHEDPSIDSDVRRLVRLNGGV